MCFIMDNNKNRMKEDWKTQSELRKMYPKDGADVGTINGHKISNPKGKKTNQ